MESNKAREKVKLALSNGDKRWKHLDIVQEYVGQDRQLVRNALADLIDEGAVEANMDPRDHKPIFALKERLRE